MVPENPVVGGTVLRRAAIQSPNFVTGVSGWIVGQDGSAEFDNVIIRNGQVISGTALFYSGPPAAGNLIASIAAAAGTDSHGNSYPVGLANFSGPFVSELSAGSIQFGLTTDPSLGSLATNAGILNLISSTTGAADSVGEITIYSKNASPSGAPLLRAGHFEALLSSVFDAGLSVAGGLTADTELVTSAQATQTLLQVTNTTPTTNSAAHVRVLVAAGFTSQQVFYGGQVSGDSSLRIAIDVDPSGNPRIRFGPGNTVPDTILSRSAANLLTLLSADLSIATVGRGLRIKEGANAKQGTAVLVAGVVTVANTSVTANSRIFLGGAVPGGTPGGLFVSAVTAGTGFTIKSTSGGDTSTVAYLIVEPG